MANDHNPRKFNWGALSTIVAVVSLAFAAGAWVVSTRSQAEGLRQKLEQIETTVSGHEQSIGDLDTRALQGLPIGTIIAWDPVIRAQSGSPTSERRELPVGWRMCDGTNGTPDLRSRFLMGAVGPASAGENGGTNELIPAGGHDHGGKTGEVAQWQKGGINWEATQGHSSPYQPGWEISPENDHDHGGDNRPSFYSIIYLVKVG